MSVGSMVEKKIKGRKRHIAVDIMGNLLAVKVHAANIHDTVSGIMPAAEALSIYPTIQKFCVDAGYRGTFVEKMKKEFQKNVDVVKRSETGEWKVLPKRWIVERTFAWLNNHRRLSKDYEIRTTSSECMIKIAISYLLLKRLEGIMT